MSTPFKRASLAAAVAVACVTSYGLVGTQAASATAGVPIGLGTVSPESGGLSTELLLNTSHGCPSTATGFDVRLSGGSIDGAVIVNDYTSLGEVLAAPGDTDPMTVPLAIDLDTARAFAGAEELATGTYTFVLRCRTQSSEVSLGDYAGPINLSSSGRTVGWTRETLPAKATLTSVSGPPAVDYRQPTEFHIDVKSFREVPAGTVQLFADGRPVSAPRTLSSGAADVTIDGLAVGDHMVTARFAPSRSDFLASASEWLPISVLRVSPVVELSVRSSGGSVRLSASVTPPVQGTVTFDGPTASANRTVRVIAGHASLTVPTGRSGSYSASFVPSDDGFDTASARGATVDAAPVGSPAPAPVTRPTGGGTAAAPRPVAAPVITARTGPSSVTTSGTTTSGTTTSGTATGGGTSGSRTGPAGAATDVAPTRDPITGAILRPTLAARSSAVTLDPRIDSGTAGNPSSDGSLTISVQGVVAGTTGSGSTSYGVDAPIGGAAANENVVVLTGELDASATFIAMSGSIVPIVIRDTRADYPGYAVSGTMTDLADSAGNVIPASYLGWTPQFVSSTAFPAAREPEDAGLVNGPVVVPAYDPAGADSGDGLRVDRPLFVSPPGIWAGTVTYGAVLLMHAPSATPPGDYHAMLTLTVTGAVL